MTVIVSLHVCNGLICPALRNVMPHLWEVVGGADKGGIVVREGLDLGFSLVVASSHGGCKKPTTEKCLLQAHQRFSQITACWCQFDDCSNSK